MQRSLRPIVFLAASLAGAHGLVSACSLDLDESLIPGAGGDASLGDSQSFGGFEGGVWSDAKTDGPSKDSSGDGEDDTGSDATADAHDSGPVGEQIDCGSVSCDVGSICCWGSSSPETCVAGPPDCTAAAIACDSSSDCGAGEVCCVLDITGSVGCATACPDTLVGMIQFCKTAAECTSGICDPPPTIIANMLPPGYNACQ